MTTMLKNLNAFYRNKNGLAALEFSFIAPVMIFLFLAIVEGSDALSASRKVSLAANILSDLVAQELQIEQRQLDDLFEGMEDIIDQRDIDVTFTVISVEKNSTTDKPVVHWSRDSKGRSPLAKGSEYRELPDPSLLDNASSLIVTEVTYDYVPTFSGTLIGDKTLENAATRWPRRGLKVQYCSSPGICTR